jgi:hypothetical protein
MNRGKKVCVEKAEPRADLIENGLSSNPLLFPHSLRLQLLINAVQMNGHPKVSFFLQLKALQKVSN